MKKKITKVPKFKDFKTTRATSSALEKILYKQIPILDHVHEKFITIAS